MKPRHLPSNTIKPLLLALGIVFAQPQYAHADNAAMVLTMPAQPLGQALNTLARESQRPLLLDASLVQQRQAPSLHGRYELETALQTLLKGSGLSYRLAANGAIIIQRAPAAPQAVSESAASLPNLKVTASRQLGNVPGEKQLDKAELRIARGTGNAEIFAGQPQLQVNNIRNEAGAIDVGIRNMQGEGRVPVIIDGALQSTHTGRGYMGTADRTYIDSDLISSAQVNVGASHGAFSSGAVGGMVKIQTLESSDILKEGQNAGLLVKGSLQNNNQYPDVPADATDQVYYIVKNKSDADHFQNGSLTLAGALRHDKVETVLAYSKRRTGNYFAGTRHYADYALDKESWEQPPAKPGMEVVNTSFQSDSLLAKVSIRPDSEQQLKLTYRRHRQRAGELLSAYWYSNDNDRNFEPLPEGTHSMPQWGLGQADVQTLSSHYTLTRADNPLLNLSVGLWASDAKMQQRNGLVSAVINPQNGDQYLHHYSNRRHGFNVLNQAEHGNFTLTTGFASQQENMRPDSQSGWNDQPGARHAVRQEQSLFANLQWQGEPFSASGGINFHKAAINDHVGKRTISYKPKLDWHGRVDGKVSEWLSWHAGNSLAHRNPSLHEASTSAEMYQYRPDFPLDPERVHSQEIGISLKFADLLSTKNQLKINASYFDNRAKGYITQALLDGKNWLLGHRNYDLFRNRGIELSADYEQGIFFADAKAVIYRKPEVCSQAEADNTNAAIDRNNANPWRDYDTPHISHCNNMGFAWSLIPSRIQPQRKYVITAGVKLPAGLKFGSRLHYHSGKENPRDWLQGTGASAIVNIPSTRLIDVFAEYQISKDMLATLNINNLRNRYAIDPGQLVTMPLPGRTIRIGFEGKF